MDFTEVAQTKPGNGCGLPSGHKPEKEPPTVPVGQYRVVGDISLLHKPIVKKRVQELRKRDGFHAFHSSGESISTWAPRLRNLSLAC